MSEKETEYALDILHGILPTIEQMAKDMMGIIRCKDCKYRDNDYCKEHHDHIDRDEFCSRGVKKDEID